MCVECPHVAVWGIPMLGMLLGWLRSWKTNKPREKFVVYEVFGSWGK